MNELELEMLERFNRWKYENCPSNEFLVEIIQQAGSQLNIQTIPDYAKQKHMSYEGVKKFRPIREIFNVKFVIDND